MRGSAAIGRTKKRVTPHPAEESVSCMQQCSTKAGMFRRSSRRIEKPAKHALGLQVCRSTSQSQRHRPLVLEIVYVEACLQGALRHE